MIYGTLAFDVDGEEIIDRIYLQFPEGLDADIYYTDSTSPSTYLEEDDWHIYNGKTLEEFYYYIDGEYKEIPEGDEDLEDYPMYYRIRVYDKGEMVQDKYILASDYIDD